MEEESLLNGRKVTQHQKDSSTKYKLIVSNDQSQEDALTYIKFEEDDEVNIPCGHCEKTFCNDVALLNHIKMQHASATQKHNIENILFSSPTLNENYKRIASNSTGTHRPSPIVQKYDANKTRILTDPSSLVSLANDDVSYIIIKTEGYDSDNPGGKKIKRNDGTPRRTYTRTSKTQVEITGPFECLQQSNLLPQGICHQIFFNCCEYSLHYREEHTKRRKAALRCQVCEKQLDHQLDAKSGNFRSPFGSEVASVPIYACTICGKAFSEHSALEHHKANDHVKSKPFQCNICLKRFTQQGGLQQHMRMHTGDRPFPCTFCDKAFTQKSGLDQHLRIHTKVKPYRCVVCSKNFSQTVHLRQHMRTHTNIQPFECGVCGKRFKQSSHLNFHLRCHSSETEGMSEAQKLEHQQIINSHQMALKRQIQQSQVNLMMQCEQDGMIMDESDNYVESVIVEEATSD